MAAMGLLKTNAFRGNFCIKEQFEPQELELAVNQEMRGSLDRVV